MTLHGIRPGDIVRVDKKGRHFLATVEKLVARSNFAPAYLEVCPIEPHITWRTATAREVVEHWRKRRTTR